MEPIYLHLKNIILEKINSGEYKTGDKIPSERELANTYNVSRMTMRQAIDLLAKDEIVKRETGRGTFVIGTQFSQHNVRSFTETLKERGYEPSTRVLEFSTVHSLKEISLKMDYGYNTAYYKIKRLRLGNNLPMALETVYIPTEKCEELKKYNVEKSLYEILKGIYGYDIKRVSYDIDAQIANRRMMKLFEVIKPVALLKVTGITYTSGDEKLFFEESYYHSDLYKYQVDIYKP